MTAKTATKRSKAGSWRLRSNGRYEYRVSLEGVQRSFYGATLEEAIRKADPKAIRTQAVNGLTVGEWLREWIESRRVDLKPQTWLKYSSVVRVHLIPSLGTLRLSALQPGHLSAFYGKLSSKIGATSIRHVHTILGAALQAAVEQGRIAANPARSIKPPRMMHRDKIILTRAEASWLLDSARGDRYEALYVLAVRCGLRLGELLALRWRDVNLEARTLTVRGNVVKSVDRELYVDTPKTRGASRTIRIPARAVAALQRIEARDGYLFAEPRGGLYSPTSFLHHRFHSLLKRAGLPPMPFHDLRHTAATHLLESGINPLEVSRLLGHASVGITLGIYGHVTTAMSDAASAVIDAMDG